MSGDRQAVEAARPPRPEAAEEHTLPAIPQHGCRAGIARSPQAKVSPEDAVDRIELYGAERVCAASACDWGPSVPAAIAHPIREMRRRGHPDAPTRRIVWDNPITFFKQSPIFAVRVSRQPGSSPLKHRL